MDEAKLTGNLSDIAYYRTKLSNEVTYGFNTLAQLPSCETVRVLGEFLYDERGYVKLPPQPTLEQLEDGIIDSPVFRRAAGEKKSSQSPGVASADGPTHSTKSWARAWILAACALISAAVWHAARSRRSR